MRREEVTDMLGALDDLRRDSECECTFRCVRVEAKAPRDSCEVRKTERDRLEETTVYLPV